jgi:dTDP-4-dehydrorhamnose 3,5-epimerase
MQVIETLIPAVKLIRPARHVDHRGFFAETFSRRTLAEAGIDHDWVQDNHSLSRAKGTVRGLHFQVPPFAQAKLVRVVKGAVLDVAVDLRHGSPSYGCHVAAVLDAESGDALYIPEGFAHGFCTLEPDTEVAYKVSEYYALTHDRGVRWNDRQLAIDWPACADAALLSARDRALPLFSTLPGWFGAAPALPEDGDEVAQAPRGHALDRPLHAS